MYRSAAARHRLAVHLAEEARKARCPKCGAELLLRAASGDRRAATYLVCREHGTIPYPTIEGG